RSAAFRANRRVDIQPDEQRLVVVIEASAIGSLFAGRRTDRLHVNTGISERTPVATWTIVILIRSNPRRVFAILLRGADAASRAEDEVAEVAGHAFVNPEELADHRLLIIGG